MKYLLTIAIFLGGFSSAIAQKTSPDGRYLIEYFEALPNESNVKFKNAKSGKTLRQGFSSGYEERSFREVSWSPDSRFLALVSRGTKTTSGIEILRFTGDSVTEVMIPDYLLNILGRKNLVSGGGHHWVSNVRWTGSLITFRCWGQWANGPGDPDIEPDNWYHFDVTLEVSHAVSPDRARLTSVSAVPRKGKGEQDRSGNGG